MSEKGGFFRFESSPWLDCQASVSSAKACEWRSDTDNDALLRDEVTVRIKKSKIDRAILLSSLLQTRLRELLSFRSDYPEKLYTHTAMDFN